MKFLAKIVCAIGTPLTLLLNVVFKTKPKGGLGFEGLRGAMARMFICGLVTIAAVVALVAWGFYG